MLGGAVCLVPRIGHYPVRTQRRMVHSGQDWVDNMRQNETGSRWKRGEGEVKTQIYTYLSRGREEGERESSPRCKNVLHGTTAVRHTAPITPTGEQDPLGE